MVTLFYSHFELPVPGIHDYNVLCFVCTGRTCREVERVYDGYDLYPCTSIGELVKTRAGPIYS